jgi:outer membrane protein
MPRLYVLAPLLLCCVASARGESLPLWEAGLGVAGLSLPDYRGSDQRQLRALPLPYLVYRGERLKADREGLRAELFDSDRVELNLSASGSLPVNSSDNQARRGMEDLKTFAEIGPSLNFMLGPPERRSSMQLRLPLRAAFALQSSPRHTGWVFAPNLLWLARPSGLPGWNLSASAGLLFQDSRYNNNFYTVRPDQVLADRPAYQAQAGFAGSQVTLSVSRRFPGFFVGGFLRMDSLHGASFEDSPLVKTRSGLSAGLGASWVFGQSGTRVETRK